MYRKHAITEMYLCGISIEEVLGCARYIGVDALGTDAHSILKLAAQDLLLLTLKLVIVQSARIVQFIE